MGGPYRTTGGRAWSRGVQVQVEGCEAATAVLLAVTWERAVVTVEHPWSSWSLTWSSRSAAQGVDSRIADRAASSALVIVSSFIVVVSNQAELCEMLHDPLFTVGDVIRFG